MRKILSLVLVLVVSGALIVSIFVLMRHEDPLARAARNSDTITMNIVFDNDAKTLTVNQTIEYRNRTEAPKSEVKFHIFANAFREGSQHFPVSAYDMPRAFPDGKSFGRIDISRVTVNGASIDIIIGGEDENLLIVPAELQPGDRAVIAIDYVVYIANVAHRLGWTDRVINLGNFYPVPVIKIDGNWMTNVYSYNGDPFFNAMHNFHVTMRKPRNFVMASSGIVLTESTGGQTRTTTVKSYAIRDWAAVLSPHLQVTSRVVNRVAVNYFFIDDENPARSLETSVRAKQTFSRLF
ncbi:MAG: hypothetical protein FWE31_01235, partial [Firmicutes bacterium]|nr:hypothetical protein [Bacillota bacterium]